MGILLLWLLSLVTQYHKLDIATEEGFRHLEHHDTKISNFENAGLFLVVANQVTYSIQWRLLYSYITTMLQCN